MADSLTKEERSKNMAAIKCRRTKPELFIRHELFAKGYRFRVNVNYIPGHPDLFLRKYNLAIFVNGCFWHRHDNCKYSYTPNTNRPFWFNKFQANIERDRKVRKELETEGIRQLVIWECFIKRIAKNANLKEQGIDLVEKMINSSEKYMVIE